MTSTMSGLETDFNFNLPHGTEEDDFSTNNDTYAHVGENVDTQADISQNHNDDQRHIKQGQGNEDSMDDLFHDPEPEATPVVPNEDDGQQSVNIEQLALDFSEDEGIEEAFDRSWSAHLPRKPPRKKKSPRRSQDSDGDDEASPRMKKPRKSLFGGPAGEPGVEEREEDEDQNGDTYASGAARAARPDLRHRMSSLNLDEGDIEDEGSQDNSPVDLSSGLGSFERSISSAYSRAPSEDSFTIPPDNQPVYELRQNIERVKSYTYVDQDNTGNYDPSKAARLQALKEKRAKAAKSAKRKSINKGKGKEKVRKEHIIKCIARLRFQAFGNVRNRTNDEDNWPDGWSDFDTDDEEAAKEYRNFYRRNSPEIDIQDTIDDPRNEVDDLTGHPAARGCEQCRLNDLDCSMIEGGTFPCDQCEEYEHDCKLLIPPTQKGRCGQCEADEEDICSFEEDPTQDICDRCNDNQHQCVASPPLNYKPPRISLDEHLYGPGRRHIQCTLCRTEKKRCSLKEKTGKPPCKYCKKHGIGCTFYDVPKAVVEKKYKPVVKQKATFRSTGSVPEVSIPSSDVFTAADLADMDRDDDKPMSREATPEMEMVDHAGNTGMLTKINTCFAHPVEFNVHIENAGDCNFCEMPMFGFVGHFERITHVIRWYNGMGYTEVGGGHCADKGPTTMCNVCTNARLQIIVCVNHEFQALADDGQPQDFESVADALLTAEPGSAQIQCELQRWCSMCFSPASWGCSTVQDSLDEAEGERVGCGLRLCDKCLPTLRDQYSWDLSVMSVAMDGQPKIKDEGEASGLVEGVPRADVGFLDRKGLLMKTLGGDEEEGEMDGDVDMEAGM